MAVFQILRDICTKLLEYSCISPDERKEQEEQGEGGQGVDQASKTGVGEAEEQEVNR